MKPSLPKIALTAILMANLSAFAQKMHISDEAKHPTSNGRSQSDISAVSRVISEPEAFSSKTSTVMDGGVATGGGTIVSTPQGIGLLDLYLYNPTAFANRRMNPNSIIQNESCAAVGICKLTGSQPVMKRALGQIKKWQSSSPIMIKNIEFALKTMYVYFHNGSFRSLPKAYYLPAQSGISVSNLKMAALYVSGFGVNISLTDFNALPEVHQTALVIHEAIRYMNDSQQSPISNARLQKLTAEIISSPGAGATLDREEYLSSNDSWRYFRKANILKADLCRTFNWASAIVSCSRDILTADDVYRLTNATQRALDETPQSEAYTKLFDLFVDLGELHATLINEELGRPNGFYAKPASTAQLMLEGYLTGEPQSSRKQKEVQSNVKAYFKGRGIEVQYLK